MPTFNHLWSDRTFIPGQSAQESYDVVGAADDNDAIAAVGIAPQSSHPQDARLIVPDSGGISVSQTSPIMRRVRVNYSNPSPNSIGNPLDQLAEILPDFVDSQEPIDIDIYGNPITNSAYSPFAQPIMDDVSSATFLIAQYESSFDIQKIMAYTYPRPTLNSDTITIPRIGTLLRGQLKLKKARIEVALKSNVVEPVRVLYYCEARGYRRIGTEFVTGFSKRVQDMGRRGFYLDTDTNSVLTGPIVFATANADGNPDPVADDVQLDGGGSPRESDKYKVKTPSTPGASQNTLPSVIRERTSTGVFLHFEVNPYMPFAGLGWKF